MNDTPELPPPPDVVWAAIVGDSRSGWWAARRLYSDDGQPLTRRQARAAVPAAVAGGGTDDLCPIELVFGPDDVHSCILPRGHQPPHVWGPAHAAAGPGTDGADQA